MTGLYELKRFLLKDDRVTFYFKLNVLQCSGKVSIKKLLDTFKSINNTPIIFWRHEGVKPVQQQLSDSRLSKVFDAAIQPPLEGVRVVGA